MKSLLPLVAIAFVCALILVIANALTHERIADNARIQQINVYNAVMPLSYNNDLYNDVIEVIEADYLGGDHAVSIFRARNNGEPVGLVMMPIIANGYNGKIKVAIGVALDGTLLGVQVIEHRETEGLGDGIDQNKSDWITNFTNHSLANTQIESWAVEKDGGVFDQLSGATISPRSVINAVRKSLEYYQIKQDRLY
jgi:electron transport complex protein RnfG